MRSLYEQFTGNFYINGTFLEQGFAGVKGEHQNNPASQCIPDTGPLPRGRYMMEPAGESSKYKKAIRLIPLPDTDMCPSKRFGFFIHGDNKYYPRTGSTGCIILSLTARLKILDAIKSGNVILTVK